MIRWFAKNHVAANILMLAILLVGGFLAFEKLGVEVEPSVQYPQVSIRISLPGDSPEDIENKIILPVEKALDNLAGVDSVEAEAYRGSAHISVNAVAGTDIDKLKSAVESRLQRINTFPQNAERPRVYIPDTAYWKEVISIAVYGDYTTTELLDAARVVRDDLTATPGISRARISGTKSKEISINLLPEKLIAYNITFNDVSRAIRQSSVDRSAGSIKENGERITIRTSNKAYHGSEFSKLTIKTANGSRILLSDIAEVTDTFEESAKQVKFNGKPTILIDVFRQDNENALDIADRVHHYLTLDSTKNKLPIGIHLSTWDDDSVSLRGRLNTLIYNLIQGALLVMLILGLFLRPSVALWVTLGIPVSFAGAAICMYFLGVTINNMSLFGFIVVLGIVVDDAIVTAENIFEKIKSGKLSGLDAAVLGTKEVSTPVTFGVVTTIAAFVGLNFFESNLGMLAKQIALVVIPVLIFSLIESKLILPSHLKHLKPNNGRKNLLSRFQQGFANSLSGFIERIYQPALQFCLHHRYAVICAFLGILATTISYSKHRMKFIDQPSVERYFIFAKLNMEQGTSVEKTSTAVEHMVDAINTLKPTFTDPANQRSLIGDIVSTSGGHYRWGNDNERRGYVMVEITPPSQRSTPGPTNQEIVTAWKELIGTIDGVQYLSIRGERSQGRHRQVDQGLNVMLRGSNEQGKIAVTEAFKTWVSNHPSFTQARDSSSRPTRELQIKLKDIGKDANLNEDGLGSQIRTAFYGTRVQKILRGEDEINVMLRLPEEARKSIHTLSTLRINLGNNKTATLGQVAEIIETTTPPNIERIDGFRVLHLGASCDSGSELIAKEQEITEFFDAACAANPGVSWKYEGTIAEHKARSKRLWVVGIALFVSLFALLAIPFKSFLQPSYVLLAIPFGIIGAIWGHLFMGIEISSLSHFGILALTGIVVNDSLVLVDYINTKRREGMPLREAVLTAGARRFRPIILTSLTTFAGLLPLMFENSIQAQFLIPMAVSLGFGILFATAITLILIPCSYMIGEEIKALLCKAVKKN